MLKPSIPPWPNFSQEEADAVSSVLLSNRVNYWTGNECRVFEDEFAKFCDTNHAIALANGSLALELALYGLGIGSANGGGADDEVIVTPRSFAASAFCVLRAGAKPVFADVDLDSQNITPETVAPLITPQTRGIICVHLAGWPCDMTGFQDLVAGTEVKLIEDCAQAHGAMYEGRPVGGLGDVAAWSFCQDKIMTTGGEGGMLTCNDNDLYERMWSFKDHGKSKARLAQPNPTGGFRYVHETVGTNMRMLEVQAVIGRIQLKRMPDYVRARSQNASRLNEALAAFSGGRDLFRMPSIAGQNSLHANYKHYVFVKDDQSDSTLKRDCIMKQINDLGLPCMTGSCPEIYLEQAIKDAGFQPEERLPNARKLGETSLMFLVHPGMENMPFNLESSNQN